MNSHSINLPLRPFLLAKLGECFYVRHMLITKELLPGTLDMLILKALSLGPNHGYGVLLRIEETSKGLLALEQVGQFPPMLLHMVGSGEQSGELDAMLNRVATYQQAEVERIVSTIVKMFEPAMLLIMGAVVLFIVMAVLLPILSMNQLV